MFNENIPEKPHTEFKALILALSAPAESARAEAAREIFARGRELARAAVQSWLADSGLLALFVLDASGFPEATIGVAVEPDMFEAIRRACGFPHLADVPPDQDAREFELEFSGGVRLDVLTTRDPAGSGAMARHLQKFGESIQQVELLVKNVDRASEALQSRFHLAPVFPKTRPGANATRVNFFLVPAPEGKRVLIELVEAETPA